MGQRIAQKRVKQIRSADDIVWDNVGLMLCVGVVVFIIATVAGYFI